MLPILILLATISSALLTIFFIPKIVKNAEEGLFDKRKSKHQNPHALPISRLGGACFIPIMLFITAVIVFMVAPIGFDIEGGDKYGLTVEWRLLVILASCAVMYTVGVIDDIYGLKIIHKLLAQIVSATIIGFGLWYPIYGFTPYIILAIIYIVYVINSINFIDGIDGLASGMGIISLLVLIIIHSVLDNWLGVILASAMIGTIMSFFYFNVFSWENKIFMGNSGSMTIGLIIGYLTISTAVIEKTLDGRPLFYVPIALSALALPLMDAIRVIFMRIKERKNLFLSDKSHMHYRMMNKGYTAHQVMRFLLFQTGIIIIVTWIILLIYNNYIR